MVVREMMVVVFCRGWRRFNGMEGILGIDFGEET